jgi:tellurite resistance protein TerC
MFLHSIGSPALWAGFLIFVLAMLALDLGLFHRKDHAIGFREALLWSGIWIALSLLFGAGITLGFGMQKGLEFFTGYVIEKALSIDNLFVFLVIFSAFQVQAALQHRVLFWGIMGALLLRGVFILAGGAFLESFHWAIYIFGAILLATGVRLLVRRDAEMHPERNPVTRLFSRVLPLALDYRGPRFMIVRQGRRLFTTLFLALVTVEVTDVIFAVDSIPAVFAVTTDPFIVFTSNIFAILGLRSLYFLLAGVMEKFRYLKLGLAGVLLFVGAKMLLSGVLTIPIGLSLGVIAIMIGGSIAISLLLSATEQNARSLNRTLVHEEHLKADDGALDTSNQEGIMNKDQVKGRIDQAKGTAKNAAGKATGNRDLEQKGSIQKAGGKARAGYGDLKEKIKKTI